MYCIAVYDIDFNFIGYLKSYRYFTKEYETTRMYSDRLKWYHRDNAERVVSYIKDTNRFIIAECQ